MDAICVRWQCWPIGHVCSAPDGPDQEQNAIEWGGVNAKEYNTSVHAIRSIVSREGLTGLYGGLSAGLLRTASYTTVPLGVFSSLMDVFSDNEGNPPDFITKAVLAITAGAVGSFIGTPAELSVVRMMADGRLPPNQRRNYKHALNALLRISREEGVLILKRIFGGKFLGFLV